MKSKLLMGAIAGLIAGLGSFAASGAEAQRAPYDAWCRDQNLGRHGGSVQICMAYTFQQCMASRTSQGESCYLNPRYDARYR